MVLTLAPKQTHVWRKNFVTEQTRYSPVEILHVQSPCGA